MDYVSKSELKKVPKKILRMRTLTDKQNLRLKKHRMKHIVSGNSVRLVNKHMRVMTDLMKQGKTFKKSHIVAQEKYIMQ